MRGEWGEGDTLYCSSPVIPSQGQAEHSLLPVWVGEVGGYWGCWTTSTVSLPQSPTATAPPHYPNTRTLTDTRVCQTIFSHLSYLHTHTHTHTWLMVPYKKKKFLHAQPHPWIHKLSCIKSFPLHQHKNALLNWVLAFHNTHTHTDDMCGLTSVLH